MNREQIEKIFDGTKTEEEIEEDVLKQYEHQNPDIIRILKIHKPSQVKPIGYLVLVEIDIIE